MRERCVERVGARLAMAAAERRKRPARARRSFSARARRAAVLAAQGYSRKEIAAIVGVAPETVSVWKRHPEWRLEIERWRALAAVPLERTEARLQLESIEAASEALDQLRLLLEGATKRVRTSGGVREVPDWRGVRSLTPRVGGVTASAMRSNSAWLLHDRLLGLASATGVSRTRPVRRSPWM
jgi:DNA-binding CsgD family transcriptional regulator